MSFTDLIPAPYRWLAIAGLAAALFGYGCLQGAEWGADRVQANWDKAKAAAIKAREGNRVRAADASKDFQIERAAITARAATPPSPEVRNALQRPICPVAEPAASQPSPSAPLRLLDLPVPAALVDELRRAGADPRSH